MNTKAIRAGFATLLLGAAVAGAAAFSMEPMTALLSPRGEGRVATYRIKNDGNERIAIRLRVLTRSISPEGEEINAPADEQFAVYPSRLVVEPGATVSAKVQWRGPDRVDSERSFRLVAEQMPIDAASARGGASAIKIMFRYLASLYVGEPGFTPALEARVVGEIGPEGKPGYRVEIVNGGLRHVVAVDARVIGEGRSFTSKELGLLSGANYLPGSGRSVFIQSPQATNGKKYDVTLEFDKAY